MRQLRDPSHWKDIISLPDTSAGLEIDGNPPNETTVYEGASLALEIYLLTS